MNRCACGCGAEVAKTWKQGHNPKGGMTGKHHSPETKAKISAALTGERHPYYGKKRAPETVRKMSEAAKGRVPSPETRAKISATKLAGGASTKPKSIHAWLLRRYPKTGICEHCGADGRTEYASLTGHNYTRERSDYAELCPGCHIAFDYANGRRKSQAGTSKPRRRRN